LDHEPTVDEIAAKVDKPVADVQRMLKLNERVTSIDTPLGSDNEKTVLDLVADEQNNDPQDILQGNNLNHCLDNWLDELTEKQREVIARRFGLRGYDQSTLEQVGAEIGLTRERVRQIQVEALKRMREILSRQGLSCEELLSTQH
jgi:RNA polymerase nonessential primary-like sigma factor